MSSLFFGETGVVRPHTAVCMPTHPRIQLKPKMASIILQVPEDIRALTRYPYSDVSAEMFEMPIGVFFILRIDTLMAEIM